MTFATKRPWNSAAYGADDGLPEIHAPLPRAAEPQVAAGRGGYGGNATAAVGRERHAELLPPAIKWLNGLPAKVQPHHLAERYPRIVNLLWSLWRQPPRCNEYFNELLFPEATLSHRAGFPVEAINELAALRQFYDSLPLSERSR